MEHQIPLEGYQSVPLAKQAADHILNYIVENGLEAGAKIPNEFELAQRIGVGRGTVREAIKLLVSKQILEIRRGAGTFVSERQGVVDDPLGFLFVKEKGKLARDLLDVRMMLEPEIAMMAAEKATKEQAEALLAQCDRVEQAILAGEDHIQADIAFHRMIAACSGNIVVEKLVPVINTSIAVFVDITDRRLLQETIETHREIADAIAAGDAKGARCAMNMHLIYNWRMIQKLSDKKA